MFEKKFFFKKNPVDAILCVVLLVYLESLIWWLLPSYLLEVPQFLDRISAYRLPSFMVLNEWIVHSHNIFIIYVCTIKVSISL